MENLIEIQFTLSPGHRRYEQAVFHELEFQCMDMLLRQNNVANDDKEYCELTNLLEATNFNYKITQQLDYDNSLSHLSFII